MFKRILMILGMVSTNLWGVGETSIVKLNLEDGIKNRSGLFQISPTKDFKVIALEKKILFSEGVNLKSELSGKFFWRVLDDKNNLLRKPKEIHLVHYFEDTDKDGLLNGWEMNGHKDVDLPAMGANYKKKDVFVYMDYMDEKFLPSEEGFQKIKDYFLNGEIENPDGSKGITLHLKKGAKVPFDEDLNPYREEILAIKKSHFPKKYESIFHYMIWANKMRGKLTSGVSLGIPGQTFVVTLGGWGSRNTEKAKIGTFMHELGHNLGLTHGGSGHGNYKPNYLSVMNYHFQIAGVPKDGQFVHDFQRIDIPSLDENKLDEVKGLGSFAEDGNYGTNIFCNGSRRVRVASVVGGVDFNCDGKIEGIVKASIDRDQSYSVLRSQNNWANIILGEGLKRGYLNLAKDNLQIEEDITLEEYLANQ